MNRLDLTCLYALQWVGKEYIWGGNGPLFDCSGFCIELLRSAGIGPAYDMRAQDLFVEYKRQGTFGAMERGALAFYGQSTNTITHVAFMLSTEHIIEAGGGGHTTRSIEDAQRQGAFIRIRLVKDARGACGRKDFVASVLPKYP